MKPSFKELNNFFLEEQGARLALYMKNAMNPIFSSFKGERLLQLGIEEHQAWLADINIEKKIVCLPYKGKNKASVISSLYELPFETASIDVVFCPFTLNLLHHKLSFLSELDRVLTHNGHLVFCGINPCSWWGINYLRGYAPHMYELVNTQTLRKKLVDLDYIINEVSHFTYWPPFVKSLFMERLYETVGQMLLPYPTGLYLLSAKKNVYKPIISKPRIIFANSYN